MTLLVSDLPDALWSGLSGTVPEWLFSVKLGLLGSFLVLCLTWRRVRPLLHFAFVFLVFYLALGVSAWIGDKSWWQTRFAGPQISFALAYSGIYLRDLGVALAVIAALWTVKRRMSGFFLTRGRIDAPIEPVPWLGIGKGESWRTFGWIFALAASLGMLIPTALALRPSAQMLLQAIPLLPAAVLFAAVNAFTEEIYFRTSLLSTLPRAIGRNQALSINVIFFGLAHYLHGSPSGVLGFLLTGFLAWLLGKSMLETKGIFWAWFIHFLPDVIIFVSYAVGWVQS